MGLESSARLGGLLVVLVAAAAQNNCFEKYQCMFNHNDASGNELKWDLHQLCHEDFDYNTSDGAGHTTLFKICGNASQVSAGQTGRRSARNMCLSVADVCARLPDLRHARRRRPNLRLGVPPVQPVNQKLYRLRLQHPDVLHGAVLRYGEGCEGKRDAATDVSLAAADCTAQGTEYFQFYLLDVSNPGLGVQLVHAGMPSLCVTPPEPAECALKPHPPLHCTLAHASSQPRGQVPMRTKPLDWARY